MLRNNKLKLFGIAFATMALVGCSYVVTPEGYNDSLVNSNDTIINNSVSTVYDSLVDDGVVNTVLFDKVMQEIAQQKLPEYYDQEKGFFANKEEFDKEVSKLVDEKFYDMISGSSYQVDNKFDERLLFNDLKQQLYKVVKNETKGFNTETVFTPETKSYALEELDAQGRNHLGGDGTYVEGDILFGDYSDYKERKLKKEVELELLYTKYLEDNSYANIGRSYARKVSYIAIEKDSAHPDAAKNTIDAFLTEFVAKGVSDLNILSKLWKGVDYSNENGELSTELKNVISTYNLRTLADNIEDDFLKIMDYNPVTDTYTPKSKELTDSTLESSFTSSYTQPAIKGKEQKDIELAKKELVTDGWYIKNGGLTSLPTSIRSRLFDIRTASDFHTIAENEASKKNEGTYNFLQYHNSTTFLVPQISETGSSNELSNVVFYDRDSSTYYIIIVEDALNSSVLNLSQAANKEEEKAIRKNAHEVAKMLGTKDSNKTEATIHYLKNAGIIFHDEDVYDYFKSNYGDAFDDED